MSPLQVCPITSRRHTDARGSARPRPALTGASSAYEQGCPPDFSSELVGSNLANFIVVSHNGLLHGLASTKSLVGLQTIAIGGV